jgi:hypothetical protein
MKSIISAHWGTGACIGHAAVGQPEVSDVLRRYFEVTV